MIALKILYDGEPETYGSPSDGRLVFGLNKLGKCLYTSIGEIMGPQVFRYGFFKANNTISVQVVRGVYKKNDGLDYEGYVTFLQKIYYEYYHDKINEIIEDDNRCASGIRVRLNDQHVDVPLRDNETINFCMDVHNDKIHIGLGAVAKTEGCFKRKSWFDGRELHVGDLLTIAYRKELTSETPFRSEAIALEMDIDNMVEPYRIIRDKLMKKGLLPA